jgi:transposase InsO family protein
LGAIGTRPVFVVALIGPGGQRTLMMNCGGALYAPSTIGGKAPKLTPLKPFVAGEPLETVSIDITGPHPKSRKGYIFILTVQDHFTKWAEALPLRNDTASVVATVLFNNVLIRFGMPMRLLSDQGAEFGSVLFQELCWYMDIWKIRTSPYRPSTNGMVERLHRTLNSTLAKVVDADQRNWCEKLPGVIAAYRATPHQSTGFSPNTLMFGRENRMPIDIVLGDCKLRSVVQVPTDEFVQRPCP